MGPLHALTLDTPTQLLSALSLPIPRHLGVRSLDPAAPNKPGAPCHPVHPTTASAKRHSPPTSPPVIPGSAPGIQQHPTGEPRPGNTGSERYSPGAQSSCTQPLTPIAVALRSLLPPSLLSLPAAKSAPPWPRTGWQGILMVLWMSYCECVLAILVRSVNPRTSSLTYSVAVARAVFRGVCRSRRVCPPGRRKPAPRFHESGTPRGTGQPEFATHRVGRSFACILPDADRSPNFVLARQCAAGRAAEAVELPCALRDASGLRSAQAYCTYVYFCATIRQVVPAGLDTGDWP